MTLAGSYDDEARRMGSGETTNCLDDGKRRPSSRGCEGCAVNMMDEVDQATGLLECREIKTDELGQCAAYLCISSTRGWKSHQFARHLPSSLTLPLTGEPFASTPSIWDHGMQYRGHVMQM